MEIQISIGGESMVAMNEAQLVALNAILAETPAIDRYNSEKILPTKRIRLEATMVVKTRTYDFNPLPPASAK